MKEVEIVTVQFKSILYDIKNNVNEAKKIIASIMVEYPKTKLIVFPELSLSGYDNSKDIIKCAGFFARGNFMNNLCQFIKTQKVSVVIGYPEEENEKIYNSIAFIDEDGQVKGNYRKMHLVKAERKVFQYGNRYTLINTPFGKLGLLICWDSAFPEEARLYAKNGADFLIISAAWEVPYDNQYELAVRARAFDNGIPVIVSNRIGKDKSFDFFGKSLFVDEMGNIIKSCGSKENYYIHHKFSRKDTLKARQEFVSQLEELRSETYNNEFIEKGRYDGD